MRLTSNLKIVIANLDRFQRGISPHVLTPALSPKVWKDDLLEHARLTLRHLVNAAPEGNVGREALLAYVEAVLMTFTATPYPPAAIFALRFGAGHPVGAVPPPMGLPSVPFDGPGRPTLEEAANRDSFVELRQKIHDWVTYQKDWRLSQDGDQGDLNDVHQKAEWILHLITGSPAAYQPDEMAAYNAFRNPSQRPHGLHEALTGWPSGKAAPGAALGGMIDDATAQQWAAAVLQVWTDLMIAELPPELRKAMKKFVRQINTTMV